MKVFVSALALSAFAATSVNAALPAAVTELMDTTVDPCDDFYQYSCGNWLKTHEIPKTDTSVEYSFASVADRNEKVIQEILKEDWPILGEFWDSCMDTATLETLGNKPLQKTLNRISSASSKEEVLKLAGEISRIGASFVTSLDVYGDTKDAKTNVLYVGNADLTLSDLNYYLDEEANKQIEPLYRKYISTIMKLSGYVADASHQGEQDTKYFEDVVITIEKKLAEIYATVAEQDGDDAYHLSTKLSDASKKFPLTFGAYAEGAGLFKTAEVTEDSNAIFYFYDYFENAENFLQSVNLKDLKAYLAFTSTSNRARHLSDAFYGAYFDFFAKALSGQQERATRESICTTRVTQFFPDLIGKYYFMKMFSAEQEENTQLMTKLIEKAMSEHIHKLNWLDDPTRVAAEAKLNKVANLIGQSKLKVSYPYSMNRDTFFDNINAAAEDTFVKKFKKVNKPVDREEWDMSPATVNAYYSPLQNKMVFPAAILQPPFYDGTHHPALNFGAIGAVIGHELTHGFDSSGRRFDGDGNQRNWWTPAISAEFDSRAQCMQAQYSSFPVIGENGKLLTYMNGNSTITENIADNGGFSLSWDAYHEYAKSGQASHLDGVTEEEADKLLFLSFAQTWCGKSRDGAMLQQIKGDPHSPGQWRANGVAMNNDNFGKTFQCKTGTKMNPEKKCQLW